MLEGAGLVARGREGKWRPSRLEASPIKEVHEWASGYRPTFGLIGVDLQTFERTPKPSLAWLGAVARRNAL